MCQRLGAALPPDPHHLWRDGPTITETPGEGCLDQLHAPARCSHARQLVDQALGAVAEDLVEADEAVRQLGSRHPEERGDAQRAQVDTDPILGAFVPGTSRSVLHPGHERPKR
ncbi:MAG: hypothetical protein ACYCVV_10150 [Acidimicrobiales bacterium]